jgi:hypothetical protein
MRDDARVALPKITMSLPGRFFNFETSSAMLFPNQPGILPVRLLQSVEKNNFGQVIHLVCDFIGRRGRPVIRHVLVSRLS